MAFPRSIRFLGQVGQLGEAVSSFSIGTQPYEIQQGGNPVTRQIVRHADCNGQGVVRIISADPVTVVGPARTVVGGRTINGAMKNPVYLGGTGNEQSPIQGFDSAINFYTAGVSLDASAGISLAPGECFLQVKSHPTYGGATRQGVPDEWAGVYVATTAVDASTLAPAMVGWSGRSSLEPSAPINWTAKANQLLKLAPPVALPRTPAVMAAALRFNPGKAYSRAESYGISYESTMPYLWGNSTGNWGGTAVNGDISMGVIALLCDLNSVSISDKVLLLKSICSFGRQCYESWKGTGIKKGGNGGQNQFELGAITLYLWVTDQIELLNTLFADVGGGNAEQYFTMTSAQAALMGPHNDLARPYNYRWRPVTWVGVNQIRFNAQQAWPNGDPSRASFTGGVVVRQRDGATALVTATSTDQWGGNATVTLTLDAQPAGDPFVVDDVFHVRPVWNEPAGGWEGWTDWLINGVGAFNRYSPLRWATYRDNQRSAAQIMIVQALGEATNDLRPMRDYVAIADQANFPAGDDWPDIHSNNASTRPFLKGFYDQHWATLLAIPQRYELTAPTALTLTRASRDGDEGVGLFDGWGPGLMDGETSAAVTFAGTATDGEGTAVQVRLVQHGTNTPVTDWVTVGTISGGVWSGAATIPRSTGWCNIQVRSGFDTGITTAFTSRWALGRKVLLLGQSQMDIWTKNESGAYSSVSGHLNTGTTLRWAPLASISESLSLISGSRGDGVRAFLGQWREMDDTPLFLIIDSTGGSSMFNLVDDGTTGSAGPRHWSDLTAKLNKYGRDVCVVIDNWGTANVGLPGPGTNGENFFNLAYGEGVSGTGADHDFTEVLRPGFLWGHSPLTRHSVSGSDAGYRQNSVLAANARDIAVGPPVHDFPIHSRDSGNNSPHQAIRGEGGTTAVPEHTYANATMGRAMAQAGLRALGLDTSQNPTVNAATRSADGTKIIVTFNRPNGGGLTSRAPTALSQFLVSENSGSSYSRDGFSTAIVGNTVELTRNTGTFPTLTTLRLRFQSNPVPVGGWSSGNGPNTAEFATEYALCQGILYEVWDGDALGLGIEIAGEISGGNWLATQNVNVSLSQA